MAKLFKLTIKKKYYHIFMIAWFILNVMIIIGLLLSKIRFGLGLADIIYIPILGGVVLIVGVFYLIRIRRSSTPKYLTNKDIVLALLCLAFSIFIILKMTYLRGIASQWDGRVFF